MQEQLQKAINLIQKTGDRIIVFDKAKPEETFVLMSLPEYEKLVIGRSEVRNLTEDELLDKINRDIAIWKSENDNDNDNDFKNVINFRESRKQDGEESYFDDNMYYYDEDFYRADLPADDEDDRDDFKNNQVPRGNSWKIPSRIKAGADEVIDDIDF